MPQVEQRRGSDGERCVLCSVFSVLTGGEEKRQGMANSLISLTRTRTVLPPTPAARCAGC